MSVNNLYLAGALALMGCATVASNSSSHRSTSQLTAVEMAEKYADVNTAYDAVARLRPNWLAEHGQTSLTPQGSTTAAVFIDDQPVGDVAALKNIPAYQVAVLQYYDVTQAGARFGIRAGGTGAIEVRLKKP